MPDFLLPDHSPSLRTKSPLLLPSPSLSPSKVSSQDIDDSIVLSPLIGVYPAETTIPYVFNALNLHQRTKVIQNLLPLLNEKELNLTYDLTLDHPKRKKKRFNSLPDEIWLRIFHFLEPKSLTSMASVDRHCYHLIKDNKLWHSVLHRHPSIFAVIQSKKLMPRLPLVPKYKDLFKLGYLTHLNWKHGRCKISHVHQRPQGTLHMDFDLNSNLVASISMRESSLWDYTTGRISMLYPGGDEAVMTTLKFSPLHVLIGSSDGNIRVWRKLDHVLVQSIHANDSEIGVIESDDTMIASGSEDATLATWDMKTGLLISRFEGHTAGICSIQFSTKRNLLVSGAADFTIRTWSLDGNCKCILNGHTETIFSLALNDQYIVSGSGDCTIKLWSCQTYQLVRTMKGHKAAVVCLQLDHSKLVSGSVDKTIKVWSLDSPYPLYTLSDQHFSGVHQLKFDETKLVSSDWNCNLVVYDFTHSEEQC